jgi:hypothetical protein
VGKTVDQRLRKRRSDEPGYVFWLKATSQASSAGFLQNLRRQSKQRYGCWPVKAARHAWYQRTRERPVFVDRHFGQLNQRLPPDISSENSSC